MTAKPINNQDIVNQIQGNYNRVSYNTFTSSPILPPQPQQPVNIVQTSSFNQGQQNSRNSVDIQKLPLHPQKHQGPRRIFDDHNEKGMRASSSSLNKVQPFKADPSPKKQEEDVYENTNQVNNQNHFKKSSESSLSIPLPTQQPIHFQQTSTGIRLLKNSDAEISKPQQVLQQTLQQQQQIIQQQQQQVPNQQQQFYQPQYVQEQEIENSAHSIPKKGMKDEKGLKYQEQQQPQQLQQQQLVYVVPQVINPPFQQKEQQIQNKIVEQSFNEITIKDQSPSKSLLVNNNNSTYPRSGSVTKNRVRFQDEEIEGDRIQGENEKLRQENNELQGQFLQQQKIINNLNDEVYQLRQQLESKDNNKNDPKPNQNLESKLLEQQLQEKDRNIQQVQQELRDAQKQIGQFADQVLILKKQLEQAQKGQIITSNTPVSTQKISKQSYPQGHINQNVSPQRGTNGNIIQGSMKQQIVSKGQTLQSVPQGLTVLKNTNNTNYMQTQQISNGKNYLFPPTAKIVSGNSLKENPEGVRIEGNNASLMNQNRILFTTQPIKYSSQAQ